MMIKENNPKSLHKTKNNRLKYSKSSISLAKTGNYDSKS